MQGTCPIADCDRPLYAKGWCNLHWRRWKKHGDPLITRRRTQSPTCIANECESPSHALDLCFIHYYRQYFGKRRPKRLTIEERFFNHVSQSPNGCWTWWRIRPDGYGIKFNPARGSSFLPHRWSYEFLRTEIPEGLVLDHLCENRACVNPWHLEPVTQQVNVLRAYERARVRQRTQ